jgi:hypothetical protein
MAGELILVVEDNEKDRSLVGDLLTFKGMRSARPSGVRRASR